MSRERKGGSRVGPVRQASDIPPPPFLSSPADAASTSKRSHSGQPPRFASLSASASLTSELPVDRNVCFHLHPRGVQRLLWCPPRTCHVSSNVHAQGSRLSVMTQRVPQPPSMGRRSNSKRLTSRSTHARALRLWENRERQAPVRLTSHVGKGLEHGGGSGVGGRARSWGRCQRSERGVFRFSASSLDTRKLTREDHDFRFSFFDDWP